MHREGDAEEALARQGTELDRREVELRREQERRERAEAEVARLKRLLGERGGE